MFMTQEEFAKLPKEKQDALMKKIDEIQKGVPEHPKGLTQLSMDEFKGIIDETVKANISKMTAVDKKYFKFPGIGEEGKDDITPVGKFAKTVRFLKAMAAGDVKTCRDMSNEYRTKANLSEGTTTAGGFLVPEEFVAEILRLQPTYGVARRECRIIPMARDVINIPNSVGELGAAWVSEAAALHSTDPTLGQITLTIGKLGAIPKVTSELLADANVDVIQYLSMLIAEAFSKEEDIQAFLGGGSPFTGLFAATGFPTYVTPGAAQSMLSYPDLVKMTTELYDTATANAKFYMHRSLLGHIRGLVTTAAAPYFGGTANDIFGFPLVSTEVLGKGGASTTYMIFGDLRKALAMGQRAGIEMKMSDIATVGSESMFEQDMVALRMIARVCFGVLLPSSYLVVSST